MKKIIVLVLAFLSICTFNISAQQPGGGPPSGFDPAKMNNGRFYGKIVDAKGKPVGYATVQIFGKKFDPQTRSLSEGMLGGQLTEANGDFSIEKLPVVGDFTLKVSLIGYAEISKTVTFGIKAPSGPPKGKAPGNMPSGGDAPSGGFPGGGFPGGGGLMEKDLGNIALLEDGKLLKEVTVSSQASTVTLALDKKVFRVDKDLSAAGGNAQDALKNVPSLSVDIDGNVSLRNGAPQIFVDGRPTTLTLDQIAADAIESVEVITNPSAKYDAGGGAAGIVNIVLKKEKRLGYNGNVRAGVDSRGGYNFGGDLNARGQKINLFGSLNYNDNKNVSEGETVRHNLFGTPLSDLTQHTDGKVDRLFINGRAGVDFLLDNRNTLTVSGNYTQGHIQPNNIIGTTTNYLFPDSTVTSHYVRSADEDRNFRNIGATAAFKHLFPKQGAEWTADLNFNRVHNKSTNDYSTLYDSGRNSLEKQLGTGSGQFVTFQSDFVNPITDKIKLEGGVRASVRRNRSDNASSIFDATENAWAPISNLADHYKFSDDVYAAYGQFSQQFDNWGYQVGLRAESSRYSGALTDRDSSFTISYPISLFPSVFLTRKLNETDNIQLSYTRRINRPNFFQTMPFTDFEDSLNLRRGNPKLLPEFTNWLELSYQNVFANGHNLLISLYYKQATNLISSYQFKEYNAQLGKEAIINTYTNA
ncbi:MAG: outer membrane beta-barrel protein, partial [Bacteroidota bacterium]